MSEQEIIEFAKQNDYCWAGLKRRHPEVAAWMEAHKKDCLLQDFKDNSRRPTACFCVEHVYRLRPDYEPGSAEKPKSGWRVYDVTLIDGKFLQIEGHEYVGAIEDAVGFVGFGGVQYDGQQGDGWYPLGYAMSMNGFLHNCGMMDDDKPAVPVRARFLEGGAK